MDSNKKINCRSDSSSEDLPAEKKKKIINCLKCKAKPHNVNIRKNYPLCKECFLSFMQHKFRTNIGQAKKVKKGVNVLIALSGGNCSRALLDIFYKYHKGAENPKSGKIQRFKDIAVAYIDDSIITGESHVQKIKEIVTPYDIPLLIRPIEDIFSISLDDNNDNYKIITVKNKDGKKELEISQNTNIDNKTAMKELYESIPLLADKECLINNIRLVLLNYMAKISKYPVLCLGDSSTKVAIDVISNTCKGRGSSLPEDIASETELLKDVVIIKPGKTLLKEEFIQYNEYFDLDYIPEKQYNSSEIAKSIDLISAGFISDLQENFPSTVTTVVSTANKITVEEENYSSYHCSLCLCPIRKDSEKWLASNSITEVKDRTDYNYDHTEVYKNIPKYYQYLCFNCHILIDSINLQENQTVYLPYYVAEKINKYISASSS
ncbi:hypothetical protein BCR32DRAFT_264496 [Anaeromyces robustus]|uniref:Cytoplasmic tRNA 2-thiolation protein 2 n=1 Tax=Anaeromyces robustus TaxID=1754192 RepID=A0A1Y1XNB0_9FUNG|nr:hypothetical protein BCR32DRAFT_264496 [Anaeromyces robustus]|eukprot:ORX87155.1 hypothetical protein BCR32DRAFT_264496 [Anaeromyces robustus]